MIRIIKKTILFLFPFLRQKKSQIEMWQDYAEKLAIKSGICIDNVLVHNHGMWGQCGPKAYGNHVSFESEELGKFEFRLPFPDKPYILVPEIKCWWTFRAWIHEIGHYVHKHYNDRVKPTFIREYEAEAYCLEMCKKSGVVNDYNMIDIKFSAVSYLNSHIDSAIKEGIIKSRRDIPKEVIDFLFQCEYMKEEMDKKNFLL